MEELTNSFVTNKLKVAFFVKNGLDSFLEGIIEELSKEYELKKVVVNNIKRIDEEMKWADICWFEWCDELVDYGSKHELAKTKKIICRIHGYEVYGDLIKTPNWDNIDEIIVVTPHIKRIYEENMKRLGKENLKIDLVYCGVDLDKYSMILKSKGFNIGFLGYINYKKNIPLTLEIFKSIYDTDKRYKLFLAGEFQDSRTLNYIQYFIKEYKLEDNVIFEGWKNCEEKKKWFEKIDYMLISSIDEGLCYAAAEAMCCGIKPVLHNCEGIKDHYPRKYIFNTIEDAIKMIKSEEYDSKEYRSFIEENYSLAKQCKNIKTIIQKMIYGNEENINSLDITYAERYAERNQSKIKVISENLNETYSNALDIGCNQGYLISTLIHKKYIKEGHGIDLDRRVVNKNLLTNKNFSFYEGDIAKYKFEEIYDLTIYNAVHHHVFGKYGKEVAFEVFKNIVEHCNRVLIFETGMVKEVGKYYWKDELLKYFGSDTVHIKNLLQIIGDRLEKIEEIDSLDIHGIKRPIFKINLYPINHQEKLFPNVIKDNEITLLKKFKRTLGSFNQKLIEIEEGKRAVGDLYNETSYYKLKKQDEVLFSKKYESNYFKQLEEANILQQVEHTKAIKLKGTSKKYGLLFPYYGWKALDEIDFSAINRIDTFKNEIEEFFSYAEGKQIRFNSSFWMYNPLKNRRLIDIVDFHAHNFLVNVKDAMILDWRVIDFEHYSEDNFERNKVNLLNIQKLLK